MTEILAAASAVATDELLVGLGRLRPDHFLPFPDNDRAEAADDEGPHRPVDDSADMVAEEDGSYSPADNSADTADDDSEGSSDLTATHWSSG